MKLRMLAAGTVLFWFGLLISLCACAGWVGQRPEEGIDLLKLEFQVVVNRPVRVLGTELGPLEEQQELRTVKP